MLRRFDNSDCARLRQTPAELMSARARPLFSLLALSLIGP